MPNPEQARTRTLSVTLFAAIHDLEPGWVRQLLGVRRIAGAKKRYGQWRIAADAEILPPGTPGTKHFKRPSRKQIAERANRCQ
jgi:hypothetical protein